MKKNKSAPIVLPPDTQIIDLNNKSIGFNSRTLAQLALPHSDLQTAWYERTNGLVSLSILADPKKGIPFGTYPRLLLSWVCTEITRTKTKEIFLGNTQTEFLSKLRVTNAGSTIAPLRDQCSRLFDSKIKVDFLTEDARGHGWKNILLADSGFEFWEAHSGKWEAYIKLTDGFYNDVLDNPVPVDINILNELRKSPMAMDVYTWLAYRTFTVYTSGGREVKIRWADLQKQFGAGYGSYLKSDFKTIEEISKAERQGLRDFKKYFIKSIQKVLQYHPELSGVLSSDSNFLTIGGAKLIK